MSLDERQFNQLKTMGISLWQSREGVFFKENKVPENPKSQVNVNDPNSKNQPVLPQELDTFINTNLFRDIMNALQIPSVQVQIKGEALCSTNFTWLQSHNPQQACELTTISDSDKKLGETKNQKTSEHLQLTTPTWQSIQKSSRIKRQLWQVICQFNQ